MSKWNVSEELLRVRFVPTYAMQGMQVYTLQIGSVLCIAKRAHGVVQISVVATDGHG